jgi:electron transport complex protein RnfE
MGIGFTLALLLIGTIREVLGDGKFFGYMVFGPNYQPVLLMLLAPGGFITIGLLLGYFNLLDSKTKEKAEAARNSKG